MWMCPNYMHGKTLILKLEACGFQVGQHQKVSSTLTIEYPWCQKALWVSWQLIFGLAEIVEDQIFKQKNLLLKCCVDIRNKFCEREQYFVSHPYKHDGVMPNQTTSHPSMLQDQKICKEELDEFLRIGMIRPSKSQQVSSDFYVKKHSEQVKGKKRLVIDYRKLTDFL